MSPDGSKVAVSQIWGTFYQTYILGITSESSADITDLKDARNLVWFPDSKRIAYIRSWQCEHGFCNRCCDLVVQRLPSGQITTIHHWYYWGFQIACISKILVTPDGMRVITITWCEFKDLSDKFNKFTFRTWDVSDL
ncbi:uncharacterized protein ARMOST_12516 [Armillaria ostoyae]|uniref:Dipeptidylpeptidase IV N-terminal domain-containing protein n=1 Tax=Armillaria ostoyae TaxID=47428 RepID=A0A284RK66_ARMOS|nr:uncharacterized protein ARMOST_12516 [Armillaria ostoyae]